MPYHVAKQENNVHALLIAAAAEIYRVVGGKWNQLQRQSGGCGGSIGKHDILFRLGGGIGGRGVVFPMFDRPVLLARQILQTHFVKHVLCLVLRGCTVLKC